MMKLLGRLGTVGAAALILGPFSKPMPLSGQASDFLLRTPKATLGIHSGYALAMAGSDIFDFTRENLTLSRRDFDAVAFGGQLAFRLNPRLDLAFDLSIANASKRSEFRDWVGTDDLPIEQTTDFFRLPLTVGVKSYLRDRGRSVGRLAWVANRWAPYVGAGAGWVWYRFEQDGEWVDHETLDIFRDTFISRGSAPTIHVYGGVEWTLGPAVFLTTEARYAWARADLSRDFVGFDALDLSGIQATAGISLRF